MHLRSVTHCTYGDEVDDLTVDGRHKQIKRNLDYFLYLKFVQRAESA